MPKLPPWFRNRLVRLEARLFLLAGSCEIDPAVDPRQLAIHLISSLEGALVVSRLQGSQEALRSTAAQLELWLDGKVIHAKERGSEDGG